MVVVLLIVVGGVVVVFGRVDVVGVAGGVVVELLSVGGGTVVVGALGSITFTVNVRAGSAGWAACGWP